MSLMRKKIKWGSPVFFGILYFISLFVFAIVYAFLPTGSFKTDLDANNFITCFYYSAVTITTLGYGDMSPIAIDAQIIVMIESVLGVVIIGMFINAIAYAKSDNDKMINDKNKLIKFNRIISIDIEFYLLYAAVISSPIEKRSPSVLNKDFDFKDLRDLFKTSLRLRDSHYEPAVKYYFIHLRRLENSITELIQNVDLSYWGELQIECIKFLEVCRNNDFSESILNQPNVRIGDEKASDFDVKMIAEYQGEVEYRPSNSINKYVALYEMLKFSFNFIDYYQSVVKEIESEKSKYSQ